MNYRIKQTYKWEMSKIITYYYFDDMIDIKKFESNFLKINKKSHRDFDIYYIGYLTVKKFNNCNDDCDYENICSVNPLYLIFHSAAGYFKKQNGEKYLILDPIEKYKEVFSGIKSVIEMISSGEKLFYQKHYATIGVNTDYGVPLDKQQKFLWLIIIIRCIFQNGKKLYPQIYLDECLYEL